MPTKTKIRTTIELNPGDKERLQALAAEFKLFQTTGSFAGKTGSISRLMQAFANKELYPMQLNTPADLLAYQPRRSGKPKKEEK